MFGFVLELHNTYQYFSFIFSDSICLHKLVNFGILIQDFLSSLEILNPENKLIIFYGLQPLSKQFNVMGMSL